MKKLLLVVSLIIINCQLSITNSSAQDTTGLFNFSPTLNKHRVDALKYSSIAAYPVSMYWLYTQWYENYPQSSFHFFNDLPEWEQMDKAGHILTTYSISNGYAGLLKWAGVDSRKAAWYGAGVGFVFQTTLEVFDGFSSEWGFSVDDIAANTIGSATYIGQELLWNEQRIKLKLSFHQTDYSQYRPNLLGKGLAENWLKDYNGQTYWVSLNPSMFMNNNSRSTSADPSSGGFPKWLSIAAGYGAEGMTGGRVNPSVVNGEPIPAFERYRQYYISLDVAVDRIKTNSKFIHALSKFVGIIKFPAPTIEFNEGHKTKYYWLYF